jgi:ribose 5-phosphate isomerase B
MHIVVGCDHAAYELKDTVKTHLEKLGHQVEDVGTNGPESVDYPEYAFKVARKVAAGEAERGVLMCGSGIGMSMAANRVPGVRAAAACEPFGAKMSRRHNDSNILCLGARFLGQDLVFEIIDVWLGEPFEGGRHQRRILLMDQPI